MRTYAGRPGYSTWTEYKRAREQQAILRRDKLRRRLPRAALQAIPVGFLISAILALGAHAPSGIAVVAFIVVAAGWPLLVMLRAYDPDADIESLREHAEAERTTAKTITRLKRHGYVVLHDRCILGSEETIGHLVIGPGGVFVMSSEAGKGIVRYSKDGVTRDGNPLRSIIERTAWFGGEVRSQLRGAMPMTKVPVAPVLVMTEADVLWSDGAVDDVTIISLKDVNSYIRHRPLRINPLDVNKVVAASERLFPPYTANRLATDITVDRDHWIALMDALRTIRERDGDARGVLDRLAQIEQDLALQADPEGRPGLTARDQVDALAPVGSGSGGQRSRRRGATVLTAVRSLKDDDADGLGDSDRVG